MVDARFDAIDPAVEWQYELDAAESDAFKWTHADQLALENSVQLGTPFVRVFSSEGRPNG